jgi:hypothetical protein
LRKTLVIVATAAVALIAAASAFAAINTYGAKMKFSPSKAGTSKKPAAAGYTQDLKAAGTNGNRTALIDNITTTIYGYKATTKGLPTCSVAQISTAKSDTACPKGAMLATGYITAVIGSPTNFTPTDPTANPCDPLLHVWNAGTTGKKINLAFFFVDNTTNHQCLNGAITTGAVPAYPATLQQKGKNLVTDVPIPSFVNRPVGLAGSLETEHLKWFNAKTKVKGKKVPVLASVGCKNGKRPWSVKYTATLPTTNTTESKTVSGTSRCSK